MQWLEKDVFFALLQLYLSTFVVSRHCVQGGPLPVVNGVITPINCLKKS